jgi:hypothetical protein
MEPVLRAMLKRKNAYTCIYAVWVPRNCINLHRARFHHYIVYLAYTHLLTYCPAVAFAVALSPFLQAIGHMWAGVPGNGGAGKLYAMQSVHKYDFEEARRLLGGKETYPACYNYGNPAAWEAPGPNDYRGCEGMQVLAFHPEVSSQLSKTKTPYELHLIYKGLLQLGLLLNRTVVWPDVPCNSTCWVTRRGVVTRGDQSFTEKLDPPVDLWWGMLPYDDFQCQWGLAADPQCSNKGRSLQVWEFEDWAGRKLKGVQWRPEEGVNVLSVERVSEGGVKAVVEQAVESPGEVKINPGVAAQDHWQQLLADSSTLGSTVSQDGSTKHHIRFSSHGGHHAPIINSSISNSTVINSSISHSTIRDSLIVHSIIRKSMIINEVLSGIFVVAGRQHEWASEDDNEMNPQHAADGAVPSEHRRKHTLGNRRNLRVAQLSKVFKTASRRATLGVTALPGAMEGLRQPTSLGYAAAYGAYDAQCKSRHCLISVPSGYPLPLAGQLGRGGNKTSSLAAVSHQMWERLILEGEAPTGQPGRAVEKLDVFRSAVQLGAQDVLHFVQENAEMFAKQPVLYVKDVVNITWTPALLEALEAPPSTSDGNGAAASSDPLQQLERSALERYLEAIRGECHALREDRVREYEKGMWPQDGEHSLPLVEDASVVPLQKGRLQLRS